MLQDSRHAIDVGAMFIKAVVKSIKAILWGELAMLPRPRKVRQIGNAIKAEKGQVDRAALAFLKKQ